MHNSVAECLQIMGVAVGRMLFVVFVDDAPIAAENYRQLFSGELVSSPLRVCAQSALLLGTGQCKPT